VLWGNAVFHAHQPTPDECRNWCIAKSRIDDELKEYNRACTSKELLPRLFALLKKPLPPL
jgi:hypothetical protein